MSTETKHTKEQEKPLCGHDSIGRFYCGRVYLEQRISSLEAQLAESRAKEYDPMIHGSAAAKQGADAAIETVEAQNKELQRQLTEAEQENIELTKQVASGVVNRNTLIGKLTEANRRGEELTQLIQPIANSSTDNEGTDRPLWWIINPQQLVATKHGHHSVYSMFMGPFWSRDSAQEYMNNRRHHFGKHACVFCGSCNDSPAMKELYAASKTLATATSKRTSAGVGE